MKKKIGAFLLSFGILASSAPNAFAATSKAPNIIGTSAITLDVETGEIIYTKDIDAKSYPASITKYMTALLLSEKKQKTDPLTYTQSAKEQPEYSVNLNLHPIAIGETMSADNVMDALLLFSGNDMAYMVADNIAGNAEKFSKMMNDKAKTLKMSKSNFVTPNGLHDPNHYTTAYDLTLLGRAVAKNPWVLESSAKPNSKITTSAGTILLLDNRNKLVGQDGCIAGKTGFTDEAGRCLLAIFERNGRKIVGAVMNSAYDANDDSVFNDMKSIINWSYDQQPTVLDSLKKDSAIKNESISYKPLRFLGFSRKAELPVVLKEDVTYYENDINKKESTKEVKLNEINPWKLNADTQIGTLTVKQRESTKSYKLYTTLTTKDIVAANSFFYIAIAIGTIAIITIIVLVILKIKNRKGRKGRYV